MRGVHGLSARGDLAEQFVAEQLGDSSHFHESRPMHVGHASGRRGLLSIDGVGSWILQVPLSHCPARYPLPVTRYLPAPHGWVEALG